MLKCLICLCFSVDLFLAAAVADAREPQRDDQSEHHGGTNLEVVAESEGAELDQDEGVLKWWFFESFDGRAAGREEIEETMKEHIFVLGVFAVIMIVAAAFKGLQHWVHTFENTEDPDSVVWYEMMQTYFEEVSIMGAVGATILVAQRNYLVGNVVKRLATNLSVEEGELMEVLEGVHCLVFMILVWMVMLTAGIAVCARLTTDSWTANENEVVEILRSTEQQDDRREMQTNEGGREIQASQGSQKLETSYAKLRRSFFRQTETDHTEIHEDQAIFSKYLQRSLVATLKTIIRLPKWIMFPPFLIGVVIFPIYERYYNMHEKREDVHGLHIMTVAVGVVMLLMLFVVCEIWRILGELTPADNQQEPVYEVRWKEEEDEFKKTTGQTGQRRARGCMACLPDKVTTYFCGTSTPKAGEEIYIFWRNGPAFLTGMVQLSLFFLALIPSVYELVLSPKLKYRHEEEFGLLCFLALCAYGLIVWSLPNLAMMGSLGDFRNSALVKKVIDETPGMQFQPHVTTPISRKLVQALKYEHVLLEFTALKQGEKQGRLDELVQQIDQRPDLLKSYIRFVFNKFDRNGNGTLHQPEVEACLVSEGYTEERAKHVVDDFFSVFDLDDSGELNESEFLALHVILVQSIDEVLISDITEKTCLSVCKRYDANKDNFLQMDEFVKAMSQMLQVDMSRQDVMSLWQVMDKSAGNDKVDLKKVARFFYTVCQCLGQTEAANRRISHSLLARASTAMGSSGAGLPRVPSL